MKERMKKRPLCVFCVLWVSVCCIIRLFGYPLGYPDNQNILRILEQNEEVLVYGQIYQREYKSDKRILFLKQTVLSVHSQNEKIEYVKVTCKPEEENFLVGDYVSVKGELKPMEAPTNPGQFDARAYYYAQKIGYTMWEPEIQLISRPAYSLKRDITRIRENLAQTLKAIAPGTAGSILAAMVLGDKADLDEKTRLLFQKGGISHVLAISGLHLGILGIGTYKGLRKAGVPLRIAGIASGLFMYVYGVMVGLGVSTLRALLMFWLKIGAEITGRTSDPPTGVAVAAAVILTINPVYLSNSSFWLSFLAVFSLMIFRGKQAFLSGVFLHFFMAPVLLYFYSELSVYGILLNLLVLPTVSVVLLSGIVGGLAGLLQHWIGVIAVLPGRLLLHIYEYLCEMTGKMPASAWILGSPTLLQIAVYYMILGFVLFLFRKNRIRKRRFAWLLLMIPAWYILCYRGSLNLEITMLDVGQGDGIVIRTPEGSSYLIDGGSSSVSGVGTYRILSFLKHEGICELEAVFLSHNDGDHINGVLEILESMESGECSLRIKKIILPDWENGEAFEDVILLAEHLSIPVYSMAAGSYMEEGDMRISCLHPSGENYEDNGNEGSMVLLLEYGDFSALFMGDLEGDGESVVGSISADIDLLKVAHHGSGYSTSEQFLEQTEPEVSLISCSENNRYGHPHEELLERLEACGSAVFITKDCGAISVSTDGEKIDVKTYCVKTH